MENNWEPRVGQKVVCIETPGSNDHWNPVKGETYLITAVENSFCQVDDFDWWYLKSRFAPLPEQYADMTAEIAQQFKEHPDTVDQPVKVLETSN